jgi:hypothetical protein
MLHEIIQAQKAKHHITFLILESKEKWLPQAEECKERGKVGLLVSLDYFYQCLRTGTLFIGLSTRSLNSNAGPLS